MVFVHYTGFVTFRYKLCLARSPKKNDKNFWDYQVKWRGLPYSECTWEDEQLLINDFKDEIDAFEMRQDNPCVPKKECKVIF